MLFHLLRHQWTNIRHLKQIHAQLIVTSLITDADAIAGILRFFAEKPNPSNLDYALAVFDCIESPTTFAWNTMIRTYTRCFTAPSAFRFFIRMRRSLVPPDAHTFPFVLKACVLLQSIHPDAEQLFGEVPRRDIVTCNTMIDGYVKSGEIDCARQLFDDMPTRDVFSWGTILAGYAQNNRFGEVLTLFGLMVAGGVKPDNVAMVIVLSGCGQLEAFKQGRSVHSYIQRRNIRLDVFLYTGLIDMYAKCGCIDNAFRLFLESREKNLVTWNSMIMGMAMHGHAMQALNLFDDMQRAEIQPDSITFLGVLVACSHAGLVGLAWKYFASMDTVYKVVPELKHYGCMADLLGRAGLLREALEMIGTMPMKPDVFVWGGLLGGCRIHGNVEIAENAVKHLLELDPEDGGIYSIMANIYAAAHRWEDVASLRKMMNISGVRKVPGCSFVEVNGFMHEFIAADKLHPQIDETYRLLDGIKNHLKINLLNDFSGDIDMENEI
ncbi:pentatricopeptide repeat-containing protein At5g61800-like isoform X2 [Nymphaea colorata]|uniref:pentatricopeptide repeat-containing protein At5g61800-like isoform X2 n=1 Tax=Nymphaea colorata TaxID=210225 RepID=UPI00129E3A60|nr:pentatricopeptide repeat-containing protein At5g61800-like isoform X2 [Nymphaea colorata]